MAGQVRVNAQTARKPSDSVSAEDELSLDAPEKYVSRGGEKLEHALNHFAIDVTGAVAIDLGASTGGVPQFLLPHPPNKNFSRRVGFRQPPWKVRHEHRGVL